MTQHRLPKLLEETWRRWSEHGDILAAGMSFYSLLSMAPLVVIALTIAGVIFGERSAREALLFQLDRMGSADLQSTALKLIDAANAGSGGVATVIAAFVLLLAASRLFLQVQDALNWTWGVPADDRLTTRQALQRFVQKRLVSFAMALGCGALLLVTIVLQTITLTLGAFIERHFGSNVATSVVATALQTVASLALGNVVFAILYRVLPDVRLRWSDVWFGGLLTSVLMLLGTWLLGMYLSRVAPAWLQGAIGSVVVFLLWTYYQAQAFLLGASFTRAWSCRDGLTPKRT